MKNALKWIKEKYTHRRTQRGDHDPWWVTLMLDVGRPGVAVLILAMSAPGEHFVATLGGYSDRLAWGMPGALTAYAGIAAVVATKRPEGAPGRKTAIAGAIISIGIAMGAQPIAHLYGSGAWKVTPIARVWLMVIVSCVPAAVFGHLLHMGAVVPKPEAPAKPTTPPPAEIEVEQEKPAPAWVTEEKARRVIEDTAVQKIADAYELPVSMIKSELESVRPDTLSAGHDRVFGQPDSRTPDTTAVRADTPAVRSIKSASVSSLVREFLSKHPDATDADLSGHVRSKKPGTKWDTIRKARDRYKQEIEETG